MNRTATPIVRDNRWLLSRLDHLWSNYFSEVTQDNPIFIKFGRYSRLRLGSIKLEKRTGRSYITITGMFKNNNIPTEAVDHTLAHELVHYSHGFSSKKVRMHKYPHVGGIVNKEMKRRGMGHLVTAYRQWIEDYKKELAAHYKT